MTSEKKTFPWLQVGALLVQLVTTILQNRRPRPAAPADSSPTPEQPVASSPGEGI